MAYPNTTVLQLPVPDTGGNPLDFPDRVLNDQALSSSLVIMDLFSAAVTSSLSTKFSVSGSASDLLGDGAVVGAAFNRGGNRVIQEVVCWAASSGSGGVSRIDVQVQQGPGGNFSSLFTNTAFKPALSSALGNFATASGSIFVSGSNMVWPARTLLKAVLDTAAGAAGISGQKGITVEVFWKPSGSYCG